MGNEIFSSYGSCSTHRSNQYTSMELHRIQPSQANATSRSRLLYRARTVQFWLLALASAVISLHLSLTAHSDNTDLMGSSLLFWSGVSLLVWRRRDQLKLESSLVSSLIGILLIALVLFKSSTLVGNSLFLRLFPAIAAFGLMLLASGLQSWRQYWRELSLLGFFAIPPGFVSLFLDLSLPTAQFATAALQCLGFQVNRQDLFIQLPTGSISVYPGCSGMAMILQLLGLALILLFLSPSRPFLRLFIPVIAILLAFGINGLRVALMAVLVALSQREAFHYWHVGDGSLIFSAIAVLLFGSLCHFLLPEVEISHEADRT